MTRENQLSNKSQDANTSVHEPRSTQKMLMACNPKFLIRATESDHLMLPLQNTDSSSSYSSTRHPKGIWGHEMPFVTPIHT